MKYYVLKVRQVLSWTEFPRPEIERFTVEGDLYNLIEYLTRDLGGNVKTCFIVYRSEEPIAKFRKFVFIRGMGEGFENAMYKYLTGIARHIDLLLAEEIPGAHKYYLEKEYPGLVNMKKYIAMAEFAGHSGRSRTEVWISLSCIKNGRLLGVCMIKVPRDKLRAAKKVELSHFTISLKYSRRKFPIEYIKGIYTSEELIKFLRLLSETV